MVGETLKRWRIVQGWWKKAIERGGREFGNTFGKMKTSQGLFPILDAIRRSNLSLLQRAIFEKFRESIFNTERK